MPSTKDEAKTTSVVATDQTELKLPKVDPKTILKDPEVQAVIAKEMEETWVSAKEIEKFYSEWLKTMFANHDTTVEQFVSVFNHVINLDEAKAQAMAVIDDYASIGGEEVVEDAMRTLDEEMNQMWPIFKRIKNTLETWGSTRQRITNWFRNLFGTSYGDIVTSSLLGLKWRIVSISEAFQTYEDKLLLNQKTASERIPELGEEVYKIDGMTKILSKIIDDVEHEWTQEFITTMINQLTTISGIKKWNLQRFILAARMNGNSRLLLKGTEFKVFGLMPSLLALNFVLSTQAKVRKVADKADDFMDTLIDQSKKQLEDNMTSEVEAKWKMLAELESITTNIEWVNTKVAEHRVNMKEAQAVIDNYMPVYRAKVKQLENNIYRLDINDADFKTVSDAIVAQLDKQNLELEKEIETTKTTDKPKKKTTKKSTKKATKKKS